MLKFLLILFLIIFVFFRLSGFVLKILGGGTSQRRTDAGQKQRTTPKGGNVNVDYQPKGKKKRTDFSGGEYVDYEEVK